MVKIKSIFIILAVCISFSACDTSAKDEEKMLRLASSFTKLTSAVHVAVRYKKLPVGISGQELIIFSTKHDPGLLNQFNGYVVKVKSQDKHVILLLCSKKRMQPLLEDAGCTAKLDLHHWKSVKHARCEFTLSVKNICGINSR